MTDYRIEPMQLEDVPVVCALETAAGMSTLGEPFFRKKLADPTAIMLVARAPHVIALFSSWVIVDELEIDNVVVTPSHQRQGIVASLLTEALRQAIARGAQSAVLEVRASNAPAQRLYESFGFLAAGRRRDYYRDPKEDAVIMRYVCQTNDAHT
ncbi:MAG: ribosomal protein S18-alanine N-acetyltransferase [Acidobacteria bacterium]|nr:ribosomal protein S18-alanine N-acetyltransferase [Acidobacteriota bacterium]